MVRLGVDPAGGMDPAAPGILWMVGRTRGQWEQLTARVVARSGDITIFLEAFGRYELTREEEEEIDTATMGRTARSLGQGADACFDGVRLLAMQPFCPPQQVPQEPPPKVPPDPVQPPELIRAAHPTAIRIFHLMGVRSGCR